MEIGHPETREDAREVARAHNRACRAAYDDLLPDEVLAGMDPDPDEATVDRWHERLQAARDRVLVASDGSVVGYAYVRWTDTKAFVGPDEAGLKEIYVDPDRWGEGIGTALLERAIDLVPADRRTLKLEVFADNEVGRRFYEARGFEHVDATTVEVDGDTYEAAVYALDRHMYARSSG